jgi:hypothetical protein
VALSDKFQKPLVAVAEPGKGRFVVSVHLEHPGPLLFESAAPFVCPKDFRDITRILDMCVKMVQNV